VKATFAKLTDGSWGIRGPASAVKVGATVEVAKKDGTAKNVTVTTIVGDAGNGLVFARIADDRNDTGRVPLRQISRHGWPGSNRKPCSMCGSRSCARAYDPRDLCDED
jgi:hypothetical protein